MPVRFDSLPYGTYFTTARECATRPDALPPGARLRYVYDVPRGTRDLVAMLRAKASRCNRLGVPLSRYDGTFADVAEGSEFWDGTTGNLWRKDAREHNARREFSETSAYFPPDAPVYWLAL